MQNGQIGKWRVSSYSGPNGECVEVALCCNSTTAVRDSKDPGIGHLVITPAAWTALSVALRA
ncbi:DUF397 domain-containing protein [Embleya sp. NBC_00888]|uniref:DUF397 domain-containing protein n=1 Tax=Embleya sp. NPDC127516 TaxID=3363990 RepID=UPI0038053457|nr:DUF397 domain-containing protein [Embleya sp. NBC_00888]